MNGKRKLVMTGRRRGLATQRGFTYAEMLTSMSIIMLLGLTAQPIFSETMQTFKLHGTARQAFAEMQKIRMTAITENTRCRAHMAADGRLVFERYDTTSNEWQPITDQSFDPADTKGMSISMPDITFTPNGTAATSGSLTIADSKGRYRTIVVSPAGSIRVD
jgi:Tfp pilus assembly protein FimT